MGESRSQLFFSVISNVLNYNFSGWIWILLWRWCFWSPTPSQQNILREGYRMIDHDWPVDFIKRKGFEHDDGYGFSSIQIYLPYQICFQCFSWLTTDSYCWCFKQDPVHHHYFWIVLICIYYIIMYIYNYIHPSSSIHPFVLTEFPRINTHHSTTSMSQPSGHRRRFPPAFHLDAPGRADPWRGSPEFFHPNVVETYSYGPPELKLGVFLPLKNGWLEDDAFPVFFCDF